MIAKMYRTVVFFLCLLMAYQADSSTIPLVLLKSCDKQIRIQDKVAIYEAINDSNFSPFNDKSAEEKFVLNQAKEVHFHYKNESGFWVKFRVKNLCKSQSRFFLEINNPTINKLSLFKPEEQGKYSEIKTGDSYEFSSRKLDFRVFVFELVLPYNSEKTYYMYVNTEGDQVNFPISLWQPSAYGEKVYQEQITAGIFYGILVLIIILHFFFYFNLKDVTHIYYLAYVVSIGIMLLSLDGLFFQYFIPRFPWIADRMLIVTLFAAVFFLIIFTQYYLDTKTGSKKYNLILNICKAFAFFFIVCSFLPPSIFNKIIQAATIFAPIVNLLIIASATVSFKINKKLTIYFIIAFAILIVGVIIIALKVNGLLVGFPFRDYGLKIGVVGEIVILSFALTVRFKMMQEETQALALDRLEKLNQFKDEQNVSLERMVRERTLEINDQKEIIEKKNTKITDSIRYAKRIQDSLLPSKELILQLFPQSFIYYKPKDIVSGDFYWFAPRENYAVIAAVDCTGHGVPGAFMSMLGSSLLNEVVNIHHQTDPDDILTYLDSGVKSALRQNDLSSDSKDGMDISLCTIEYTTGKVQYAGAKRPLFVVSKEGELNIIKGNQFSIGGNQIKRESIFENTILNLNKGDAIYMFTDGYIDQFGGENNFKFLSKNFKELLLNIHSLSMEEQRIKLEECLENWKGNRSQTDDILVIGIRI